MNSTVIDPADYDIKKMIDLMISIRQDLVGIVDRTDSLIEQAYFQDRIDCINKLTTPVQKVQSSNRSLEAQQAIGAKDPCLWGLMQLIAQKGFQKGSQTSEPVRSDELRMMVEDAIIDEFRGIRLPGELDLKWDQLRRALSLYGIPTPPSDGVLASRANRYIDQLLSAISRGDTALHVGDLKPRCWTVSRSNNDIRIEFDPETVEQCRLYGFEVDPLYSEGFSLKERQRLIAEIADLEEDRNRLSAELQQIYLADHGQRWHWNAEEFGRLGELNVPVIIDPNELRRLLSLVIFTN